MRKAILFLLILMPLMASAQSDDFGIWTSVGAEKKVNKKFAVDVEAEYRTRDNSGTSDRWSFGVGARYKLTSWLRASAGYTLLYDHNDKTTYKASGKVNKEAVFWGTRHRFNVTLTALQKFGDLKLSLRERWQYTYRPEKTIQRYDVDDEEWESKTYRGKGRNVLRSRLQADYNIPKSHLTPYVSAELFNAWSVQKTRYTVGLEWDINKHNGLEAYYRYQNVRNDDDDNEPNRHILGIGYTFKF